MSHVLIDSLDQSELFQLAVKASQNGDSNAAITYAEKATRRSDATAAVHLLLGAEYAQIKSYDLATREMECAIAIDPSLSIARFQLGLLLLSSGDALRAADVLTPLTELGHQEALMHFASGLLFLAGDRFVEAMRSLTIGIELNLTNPALNHDMQQIISRMQQSNPDMAEDPQSDELRELTDTRHIFISAYTGSGNN